MGALDRKCGFGTVMSEVGTSENVQARVEELRYTAQHHDHAHGEVDDSAVGESLMLAALSISLITNTRHSKKEFDVGVRVQ